MPTLPAEPIEHLNRYIELCNRANGRGSDYVIPMPFTDPEDWSQYNLQFAVPLSANGVVDSSWRLIVHDCNDGESYFWYTGGYYEDVSVVHESPKWELITAFHFGGDATGLVVFWHDGGFTD